MIGFGSRGQCLHMYTSERDNANMTTCIFRRFHRSMIVFSENGCGSEAGMEFARVLADNSTIHTLNLGGKWVGAVLAVRYGKSDMMPMRLRVYCGDFTVA